MVANFFLAAICVWAALATLYLTYRVDSFEHDSDLTILVSSSMQITFGGRSQLLEEFKKKCLCSVSVRFGEAPYSQALLSSKVDVILGIDPLLQSMADTEESTKLFAPIDFWNSEASLKSNYKFSELIQSRYLVTSWSPLWFLTKEKIDQGNVFLILADHNRKYILQNPRSSLTGLYFFDWLRQRPLVKTKSALETWQKLSSDSYATVSSWSKSYYLFQTQKDLQIIFSQVTSIAYHLLDGKTDLLPTLLPIENEQLPVQLEALAWTAQGSQNPIAKAFIVHLMSLESQKEIMLKSYMLPNLQVVAQEHQVFRRFLSLPIQIPSFDQSRSLRSDLENLQ